MNAEFSGKYGPGFSIDINRGGFDLPFGVEKPDSDGFVRKLEALENNVLLARYTSKK